MKLRFHRRLEKMKLSRRKLRGGIFHGWFGHYLLDKSLWRMQRESTARAWFIGFLIAASPFLGAHMILSIALAIVFRANIPITFALIWLSNVFTAPFFYPAAYLFGCWTLRIPGNKLSVIQDVCQNMMDYLMLREPRTPIGSMDNIFSEVIWPLLFGCLVIGLVCGISGYILTHIFWRDKKPAHSTDKMAKV